VRIVAPVSTLALFGRVTGCSCCEKDETSSRVNEKENWANFIRFLL